MRKLIVQIKNIVREISKDNITVFSAYSSFYMVISFVPFLMMILAILGRFMPITSEDFVLFAGHNFPKSVINFISYIIDEILVFDKVTFISVPAITLLWTASRSVVAIEKGLESVYKVENRRNIIKLNLYGIFYTFTFLMAILFSLIIMVFGNLIADTLESFFPYAIRLINLILSARPVVSLAVLSLVFVCIYTFIPGRKLKIKYQFPGAVFAASGWMVFSLLFSIYIDNFSNKSYLYGSLTAIIIFMLWIYFCMIIMFLGGELNYFLMREKGIIDK